MNKYRKTAEKELNDNIHPDILARDNLENARLSNEVREQFFNDAFGAIMFDYFLEFIGSEPHELKKREFIYNSVLALGDVKGRLVQYETLGKNIMHLHGEEDNNEGY